MNTPPNPPPVCSNPADRHSSKAPSSRLLHASTLIHLKFPRRLLCASSPIAVPAAVLSGCCCAPIAGQDLEDTKQKLIREHLGMDLFTDSLC
ncbi:hypothetical protein E3N88_12850 [Mikania micrantha]|uniref:Uncharacterized protein n=1 Tax=Mikania micrantha TaxID=192012 RepID=A0A5N6P6R5_9ASTR|nr:hypothetical protein E3N88_12850 [Mikania micrantha]